MRTCFEPIAFPNLEMIEPGQRAIGESVHIRKIATPGRSSRPNRTLASSTDRPAPPSRRGESASRLTQSVRSTIEREFVRLHSRRPRLLHLAVNEAAALAWYTEFPHLFFPLLAWEKAQALAAWESRQQSLRPGDKE